MSYPPPPGSTNQPPSGRSTPQTHGLPPRPPPGVSGSNYGAPFAGFKPRSVAPSAPQHTPSPAPQYNYPSNSYDMNAAMYSSASPYTGSYAPANPPQQYAAAPGNAYGSYDPYAQAAPQMHNPFAKPSNTPGYNGSAFGTYDPDQQAQIQQWQSQYSVDAAKAGGKPGQGQAAPSGNANTIPLGSRSEGGTASAATTKATAATTAEATKQKTVVREGGGQKWEDPTLLEWGNHHRLFVGNLAGEVTDESLLKAFARFPSVQKARVVRDKRTTKSKGFGFVSLADADEYFQAAREMNGKYIGSHPVLIKRAEAEIKAVSKKDNKGKNDRYKGKVGGNKDKDKDALGANTGGGVAKKAAKPEGKYKVLG